MLHPAAVERAGSVSVTRSRSSHSGKRRLRAGVERVFPTHNSTTGRLFGRFSREQLARFEKGASVDARVLIRDAAAVNVDVVHLTADVESARQRNRRTE